MKLIVVLRPCLGQVDLPKNLEAATSKSLETNGVRL